MALLLLPVPHLQQRAPGDCLAACAAMILIYLNLPADYNRLLKLLRIQSEIGTPASNIRNLAQLGVDIIYEQGTLAMLASHLNKGLPCIVSVRTGELPYWQGENLLHAVVVVGLDKHDIYLNDPAFPNAPIQVMRGDFDLAWLDRDEFYAVVSVSK
ncbi:MAG: cysteine peptidase family C39 domain-containing protein [Chloroflexi bacterium]|nr:cysteine peptidase family C39 domain-containing protein [Chloroflexota bacterium]